jgi:hypothetical protein
MQSAAGVSGTAVSDSAVMQTATSRHHGACLAGWHSTGSAAGLGGSGRHHRHSPECAGWSLTTAPLQPEVGLGVKVEF